MYAIDLALVGRFKHVSVKEDNEFRVAECCAHCKHFDWQGKDDRCLLHCWLVCITFVCNKFAYGRSE